MNLIHRANQYTGKYWTDERIEELNRLWRSGIPLQEIADLYGVKPDTIYSWCSRRFKFGRRCYGTLIEKDPDKARFMRKNYPHMSNATIAVYFGVSKDCVHDTATRMRLFKTEQFRRDETAYRIRRSVESRKRNKEKTE